MDIGNPRREFDFSCKVINPCFDAAYNPSTNTDRFAVPKGKLTLPVC